MKKLLTVLGALLVMTISFAQDVEVVQKALITKRTATWCPFCGTWGWDMMEALIEDNEDNAIILGAHFSGDLTSSTASEMLSNFGGSGQPRFFIGRTDQGVSSSNWTAKRADIENQVNSIASGSPIANTGIAAELAGTTLDVQVRTEFFEDANGEYYLSVYLKEDNVINNQAGNSPNASHPDVIRGAVSSTTFGNLINSGNVTAGQTFAEIFQVDINDGWDEDNLALVAIIWEKIGNEYHFINGSESNDFHSIVDISNLEDKGANMEVRPTLANESAYLVINAPMTLTNVNIISTDVIGQRQVLSSMAELTEGVHRLQIRTLEYLARGTYTITLSADQGRISSRCIVQ